jgi:hypothetical protein
MAGFCACVFLTMANALRIAGHLDVALTGHPDRGSPALPKLLAIYHR